MPALHVNVVIKSKQISGITMTEEYFYGKSYSSLNFVSCSDNISDPNSVLIATNQNYFPVKKRPL